MPMIASIASAASKALGFIGSTVITYFRETYFNYVTLLVKANWSPLGTISLTSGANSQNTVPFTTDSSSNGSNPVVNGTARNDTTNPYSGGYYSVYFNGSTDYLSIPHNTAIDLSTGAPSFTIECWVWNAGTTSSSYVFNKSGASGTNAPAYSLGPNATGSSCTWSFQLSNSGGASQFQSVTTASSYPINTWLHFAICYNPSNTTASIFVNGVFSNSAVLSQSVAVDRGQPLYIGDQISGGSGSGAFQGGVSNLRIVKGAILYPGTASFIPSTTPLTVVSGTGLIACNASRFIDNSTNAFTVTPSGTPKISQQVPFTLIAPYTTYGSVYFDGTSTCYLSGSVSGLNFGTQNISIEMWVYPTVIATTQQGLFTSGSGNLAILLVNGNGGIQPGQYGTAGIANSTGTCTAFAWNHWVVTRNGNTWRVFINGVLQGYNSSYSFSPNDTSYLIGYGTVSSNGFTGYISDVNVVVNNIPAAYNTSATTIPTTVYTVPTSPNVNTSYTQLLTCQYNGQVTNTSVIDSSNLNVYNPLTKVGNAVSGTFSPYSNDNWGVYFNGSSTIQSTTNLSFSGVTVFTMEAWMFTAPVTSHYIISTYNSSVNAGWSLQFNAAAPTIIYGATWSSSSNYSTFTPSAFSQNTWYHVAMVRNGTSLSCYLNGTLVGTNTFSGTWTDSTAGFSIGYGNQTSYPGYAIGYISNLRIVNGFALYSSNFTPSTAPLTAVQGTVLLTCQNRTFVDNGLYNLALTNNSSARAVPFSPFNEGVTNTPTNYSVFFNGSSDYLSVPSAAYVFGTNNFTVEAWVCFTAYGSSGSVIIDNWPYTSGSYVTGQWQLWVTSAGVLTFAFATGASAYSSIGTGTLTLLQWVHVAAVRNGTTITVYLNGVAAGSGTTSQTIGTSNSTSSIGRQTTNAYFATGSITNVRLVNNTAVYTTNFTPPTSPLTAIAGTQLLTCQNSTYIDNSTNAYTITAGTTSVKIRTMNPFGYTTVSTATPYNTATNSGSIYFDGASYLTMNAPPLLAFGSNNFTVEFWMYSTSWNVTSGPIIFDTRPSGTNGSYIGAINFATSTTGTTTMNWTSNSTVRVTSSSIMTVGNWHHIAFVRIGTVLNLYIDGIFNVTGTESTAFAVGAAAPVIGGAGYTRGSQYFNGYLCDLRINNGSALYTSNFFPPAAPLTNVAGTVLLLTGNNSSANDVSQNTDLLAVSSTAGVPQYVTTVKKFSSGSLYFSGTSPQALKILNQQVGDILGGNFTIECWIYTLSNTGGYQPFIMYTNGTADQNGWVLYTETANQLSFLASAATNTWSVILNTGSTIPSINTWHHIAVTRSGSTWTLYMDGSTAQTTTSSVTITQQTGGMYIGYYPYFPGGARSFNGYIDEVRITKGVARYTGSTYTIPTSGMTTQ